MSQLMEYGALLSVPIPCHWPSQAALKRTSFTPLPPALSLALTEIVTVLSLIVVPLAGAVK
jgi:hypothetical protein